MFGLFGLRITTKRELALTAAIITDLKEQNKYFQDQTERERQRADGAINILLAKTQQMVIAPVDTKGSTEEDLNRIKESMNLFDEDQGEIIERVQADNVEQ